MPLDLTAFVRKWQASKLTEKSAAKDHFRDLCEVLGVPHPTEEDLDASSYTFEKRLTKVGGGEGFADVWKRGYFAWEYKSKGADLNAAYKQLNEYHEDLDNPPLLIVCDFDRFEVHTKFENTPTRVYRFKLEDLLHARDTPTSPIPPLEVLRFAFGDYNQLRPNVTAARVTEAAARDFLKLAQRLELERAAAPERPSKEQIAHFLMRLVFCLFADSVGLLPEHAFRKLVLSGRASLRGFNRKLPVLFEAMSQEHGFFGADDIRWFNGGLFNDSTTIELDHADMGVLIAAAQHDWSHIEPAIFGTLFERSLDAAKRSMIGAHYTSTDDILLLIEPVIMTPLRRRWDSVRQLVLDALAKEEADTSSRRGARLQLNRPALTLLQDWATELARVRILDPACGSGNFLYVALKRLLDLWQEARAFGLAHGLALSLDPMPSPAQLYGVEIDFYAHEIASIVVWIGFLQWKHDHGVKDEKEPLLRKLTNIQHADAIIRYDEAQKSEEHPDGKPYEPEWPEAEYIVGNPPFLGDKMMRGEMGDQHVTDLRTLYGGRVPGGADLVTYWFEKSRAQIEAELTERAGLIATNSIRMVGNRPVLERIKTTGDIFAAWSDNPWVLDGAAVRISLIAFDNGSETQRCLDGRKVESIHADLSSGAQVTEAVRLAENENLCFLGIMKGGPFDIDPVTARKMLEAPLNPNGRPNADVVKRRLSGQDLAGRDRNGWIIDFVEMPLEQACLYEIPFEYVKHHVKPIRDKSRDERMHKYWWLHGRSRPALRQAVAQKKRYLATPEVSKYRLFRWVSTDIVPDHKLHVIARDDDYFFGVLQSRLHVDWSLRLGSTLEDRPSYNSSTTFDTFPFPWPPGTEPSEANSTLVRAIADAARELVRLREAWLNPLDKYGNPVPEADLKAHTLTKLYNARPEWLANAHRALDEAVFAAYGWPSDLTDQQILERLLALNHERAANERK